MDEYMLIAIPAEGAHAESAAPFDTLFLPARRPAKTPTASAGGTRAHLAPWQVKMARDMMLAQMAGGLVLADVAARLKMSVSHFIKAFRETEGVAPYHWYMQRRIAKAMAMLDDGAIPLSRIADECGFADQSHFTKAFTRLLGVSPGRWRRGTRPSHGEG